jgi:hypothetical protein
MEVGVFGQNIVFACQLARRYHRFAIEAPDWGGCRFRMQLAYPPWRSAVMASFLCPCLTATVMAAFALPVAAPAGWLVFVGGFKPEVQHPWIQ